MENGINVLTKIQQKNQLNVKTMLKMAKNMSMGIGTYSKKIEYYQEKESYVHFSPGHQVNNHNVYLNMPEKMNEFL